MVLIVVSEGFTFVVCAVFCLPVLGNAWANENMFTAAEGIIWFRYHNYVASKLHQEHPEWSDEVLFQNARKAVVATFQVGGNVYLCNPPQREGAAFLI